MSDAVDAISNANYGLLLSPPSVTFDSIALHRSYSRYISISNPLPCAVKFTIRPGASDRYTISINGGEASGSRTSVAEGYLNSGDTCRVLIRLCVNKWHSNRQGRLSAASATASRKELSVNRDTFHIKSDQFDQIFYCEFSMQSNDSLSSDAAQAQSQSSSDVSLKVPLKRVSFSDIINYRKVACSECERLQLQIDDYRDQISSFMDDNVKKNQSIAVMRNQMKKNESESLSRIQALERHVNQLELEKDHLLGNNLVLERRLKETDEASLTLPLSEQQLQQRLSNALHDISEDQEQRSKKVLKILTMKDSRIAELEAALASALSDLDVVQTELRMQTEVKSDSNLLPKEYIVQEESTHESLNEIMKTIEGERESRTKEVEELKDVIESLHMDLQNQSQQRADAEDRIEVEVARTEILMKEIASLRQDLQHKKPTLASLVQSKTSESTPIIEEQNQLIKQQEDEIVSLKNEHRELLVKISKLEKNRHRSASSTQSAAESSQSFLTLQNNYDSAKATIERMTASHEEDSSRRCRQFERLSIYARKLETELQAKNKDLQNMQSEIDVLGKKLKQLEELEMTAEDTALKSEEILKQFAERLENDSAVFPNRENSELKQQIIRLNNMISSLRSSENAVILRLQDMEGMCRSSEERWRQSETSLKKELAHAHSVIADLKQNIKSKNVSDHQNENNHHTHLSKTEIAQEGIIAKLQKRLNDVLHESESVEKANALKIRELLKDKAMLEQSIRCQALNGSTRIAELEASVRQLSRRSDIQKKLASSLEEISVEKLRAATAEAKLQCEGENVRTLRKRNEELEGELITIRFQSKKYQMLQGGDFNAIIDRNKLVTEVTERSENLLLELNQLKLKLKLNPTDIDNIDQKSISSIKSENKSHDSSVSTVGDAWYDGGLMSIDGETVNGDSTVFRRLELKLKNAEYVCSQFKRQRLDAEVENLSLKESLERSRILSNVPSRSSVSVAATETVTPSPLLIQLTDEKELLSQLANVENDLAQCQLKCDGLASDLITSTDLNNRLTMSLEFEKNVHVRDMEEKNSQIQILKDSIDSFVRKEHSDLSSTADLMLSPVHVFKIAKRCIYLTHNLHSSREELSGALSEIAKLTSEKSSLIRRIYSVERQYDKKVKEFDHTLCEFNSLRKEHEKVKDELSQTRIELKTKEKDVTALHKSVSDLDQNVILANLSIDVYKDELQRCHSKHDEAYLSLKAEGHRALREAKESLLRLTRPGMSECHPVRGNDVGDDDGRAGRERELFRWECELLKDSVNEYKRCLHSNIVARSIADVRVLTLERFINLKTSSNETYVKNQVATLEAKCDMLSNALSVANKKISELDIQVSYLTEHEHELLTKCTLLRQCVDLFESERDSAVRMATDSVEAAVFNREEKRNKELQSLIGGYLNNILFDTFSDITGEVRKVISEEPSKESLRRLSMDICCLTSINSDIRSRLNTALSAINALAAEVALLKSTRMNETASVLRTNLKVSTSVSNKQIVSCLRRVEEGDARNPRNLASDGMQCSRHSVYELSELQHVFSIFQLESNKMFDEYTKSICELSQKLVDIEQSRKHVNELVELELHAVPSQSSNLVSYIADGDVLASIRRERDDAIRERDGHMERIRELVEALLEEREKNNKYESDTSTSLATGVSNVDLQNTVLQKDVDSLKEEIEIQSSVIQSLEATISEMAGDKATLRRQAVGMGIRGSSDPASVEFSPRNREDTAVVLSQHLVLAKRAEANALRKLRVTCREESSLRQQLLEKNNRIKDLKGIIDGLRHKSGSVSRRVLPKEISPPSDSCLPHHDLMAEIHRLQTENQSLRAETSAEKGGAEAQQLRIKLSSLETRRSEVKKRLDDKIEELKHCQKEFESRSVSQEKAIDEASKNVRLLTNAVQCLTGQLRENECRWAAEKESLLSTISKSQPHSDHVNDYHHLHDTLHHHRHPHDTATSDLIVDLSKRISTLTEEKNVIEAERDSLNERLSLALVLGKSKGSGIPPRSRSVERLRPNVSPGLLKKDESVLISTLRHELQMSSKLISTLQMEHKNAAVAAEESIRCRDLDIMVLRSSVVDLSNENQKLVLEIEQLRHRLSGLTSERNECDESLDQASIRSVIDSVCCSSICEICDELRAAASANLSPSTASSVHDVVVSVEKHILFASSTFSSVFNRLQHLLQRVTLKNDILRSNICAAEDSLSESLASVESKYQHCVEVSAAISKDLIHSNNITSELKAELIVCDSLSMDLQNLSSCKTLFSDMEREIVGLESRCRHLLMNTTINSNETINDLRAQVSRETLAIENLRDELSRAHQRVARHVGGVRDRLHDCGLDDVETRQIHHDIQILSDKIISNKAEMKVLEACLRDVTKVLDEPHGALSSGEDRLSSVEDRHHVTSNAKAMLAQVTAQVNASNETKMDVILKLQESLDRVCQLYPPSAATGTEESAEDAVNLPKEYSRLQNLVALYQQEIHILRSEGRSLKKPTRPLPEIPFDAPSPPVSSVRVSRHHSRHPFASNLKDSFINPPKISDSVTRHKNKEQELRHLLVARDAQIVSLNSQLSTLKDALLSSRAATIATTPNHTTHSQPTNARDAQHAKDKISELTTTLATTKKVFGEEVQSLQVKVHAAESRAQSLELSLDSVSRDRASLSEDLQQTKRQLDDALQREHTLDLAREQWKHDYHKTKSELESLRNKYDKMKRNESDPPPARRGVSLPAEDQGTVVRALEEKLRTAIREVGRREGAMKELKQQITTLTTKMNASPSLVNMDAMVDVSEQQARLTARVAGLRQELTIAKNQIESLHAVRGRLESENESLKCRLQNEEEKAHRMEMLRQEAVNRAAIMERDIDVANTKVVRIETQSEHQLRNLRQKMTVMEGEWKRRTDDLTHQYARFRHMVSAIATVIIEKCDSLNDESAFLPNQHENRSSTDNASSMKGEEATAAMHAATAGVLSAAEVDDILRSVSEEGSPTVVAAVTEAGREARVALRALERAMNQVEGRAGDAAVSAVGDALMTLINERIRMEVLINKL